MTRNYLSDHCRIKHGTPARALHPDEEPLKPRYLNWHDYVESDGKIYPEPDLGFLDDSQMLVLSDGSDSDD